MTFTAMQTQQADISDHFDPFYFLCSCLRSDRGEARRQSLLLTITSPVVSWVDVVDLAANQLVVAAVAHQFEQLGLFGELPEIVERYFRAGYKLNKERNKQLHNEAVEIVSALNEIDVVPYFIKGSAGMLSGVYDDPAMRWMSDLDIIVAADRGEESINRLTGLGYKRVATEDHPQAHWFAILAQESKIAPVDLHRDVIAYPHQKLLSAREVIDQGEILEIGGVRMAVPSPTHQVILNVAHAQLNDHCYAYGFLPLRSLYDFAILTGDRQDAIDWQEVDERFARDRSKHALDYHCLAAARLLNCNPRTPLRTGPAARFLLGRARFLKDNPQLHGISFRIMRVLLLMHRELSSSDTRGRLMRNIFDRHWWKRHMKFFWQGRP
jgi:hypothetical protein